MIGFGSYGKKVQALEITSLSDARLVRIDPQVEGFFDVVLNFKTTDEMIKSFIEAIEFDVKTENLEAFYKPIYDPSEGPGKTPVIYQKGKKPAVGHSYKWWCETATEMPLVEGRNWSIISEYQYYAFLVYLVNEMVKAGKTVLEALKLVVSDSKEIGRYRNSVNLTKGLEMTGARCVCGVYDLANVFKILRCSNSAAGTDGFWIAGGVYRKSGSSCPLANLNHYSDVNVVWYDGVAMLVL